MLCKNTGWNKQEPMTIKKEQTLVDVVRQYPSLYNKSSKDYKDTTTKPLENLSMKSFNLRKINESTAKHKKSSL